MGDESKPKFIEKIDKSQYINIEVKGKMSSIPNWYSFKAEREYFNAYEKDNNYRNAFCNLVFYMINNKKDNQDISIKNIEEISDNELIKIMNTYLHNNYELECYFKGNFNDNYFETFYLAIKMGNNSRFKDIGKALESLNKNIADSAKIMYDGLNAFQKNIQATMKPFILGFQQISDKLAKQFSDIFSQLEEFNEEVQQFKKIIVILGFPPHDLLMPEYIHAIVNRFNNDGINGAKSEAYRIYVTYFNNDAIKTISNEWYEMKLLGKRKKIIRQAVKAHLQGDYYLSIPVIFSQMEGLIANVFNHEGKMNYNDYEKYLNILLNDKDDMSFDDLINKFFSSIILVSFQHNKPIQSILSRHAIIHGGDTRYGTKINSIKALLIFDYMINKMNDYKNKK